MNEYGKRVAKKMEDYMGDPNSVSKEINDIQNAIEGVEVRGALAAGVAKSFNKSKWAEEKAIEQTERVDTLIKENPQPSEVVDARGNFPILRDRLDSVDSQLEQAFDEINDLDQQKADITYVNEELSHKMNRGESITVNQIDKNAGKLDQTFMTEEFLQQMAGNTPINAVPADNSITTAKLVDGAVTSAKRTARGHIGSLVISSSAPLPNFDEENHRLTIYPNAWVTFNSRRYAISSERHIPLFKAEGSSRPFSNQILLFNIATQQFRFVPSTQGSAYRSEDEIELMVLSLDSESKIKSHFATFDFSINGISDQDRILGDIAIVQVGSNTDFPDINEQNKTLTLYGGTYIYHKDERRTIDNDVIIPLDEVTFGSVMQQVAINWETKEFTVRNGNASDPVFKDNDVLIMAINWDSNNQNYVRGVYSTSPYTINGLPPFGEGVNNKPYYFMPGDIIGHYKPNDEATYDDFDYDTTTPEQYNQALLDLADEYPNYLTLELKGKDQSGTYDIYEVTLRSEQPNITIPGKDIPKVIGVSGLHGGEKNSVWSLYYFIKDLCEQWQEQSSLEYLHYNIEFKFIPMANPWGIANNSRANSRGVDLNRNWDTPVWVREEESSWGTILYGGEYPFSEVETQYVRDMILENLDSIYFCDYHTNNSSGDEQDRLMWIALNNLSLRNENLQIAAKYTLSKQTREFVKDYGQPDDGIFGYITQSDNSSTAKYYAALQGIPASTTECFRKFPNETELYTPNTIKACTEYIGNWFINVVKQFKNTT